MEDRRTIKSWLKGLQRVRTWQLVMLLILFGFLTATFLRLNNIGMIQRRDAVIAADEAGDPEAVRARLVDLQRFVAKHMNTGENVVYLAASYDRDRARLIEEATRNQNNDQAVINKMVDDICKPQFSGYTQGYVDCFAREFAKFDPGQDPVSSVELPEVATYKHVFVSPKISFDFAGLSLLITALLALMILIRATVIIILRVILLIKYRSV